MIKLLTKRLIRNLGFELRRYAPPTSDMARMIRLLDYHNIDLVLDIGANVGQYASLLREGGFSGKIVSFEPISSAHSKLLSLSRNDPMWEIAPQMAIGNDDGSVEINISSNSYSSSILDLLDSHLRSAPDAAFCNKETVRLSRLDTIAAQYINQSRNTFLKIDVQGYERQVIEGAKQILSELKGIQLELSLVPLYKDQPLYLEMVKLIEDLGFELYAYVPGFTDLQSGRMLQMDGIFFRK